MESPAETRPARSKWTLGIVIALAYLYPALLFGVGTPYFRANETLAYFVTIISGLFFGGLALWGMRRDGIPGSKLWNGPKSILTALARVALVWVLMIGLYLLLAGPKAFDTVGDWRIIIQQWLFSAMGEELLFRGYLFNRLELAFGHLSGAWPRVAALLLSNLIFSTMHLPVRIYQGVDAVTILISMVAMIVLGIFFAYLYLRTKNIVFAGLFHGGWNEPLVGASQDYIQLAIAIVVVELFHLASASRAKKTETVLNSPTR